MSREAVQAVIAEFGGQKKMAVMLGGCQQLMANWVKQGYMPIKHVKSVAATTKVPLIDLVQPEIYEIIKLIEKQNAQI